MKKEKLRIINLLLVAILMLGVFITTTQAVTYQTSGTLTIIKIGKENGDMSADDVLLEGAEFTIYKVGDDDDLDTAKTKVTNGSVSAIASGETDSNGEVVFEDLELGRYLVVETKTPENVVLPAESFLVDIPMTVTDETTGEQDLNYNVVAQPKNTLTYAGVSLVKKDNNGTVLAGVEFILQKESSTDTWTTIEFDDGTGNNTTTLTTGENGTISVDGLSEGNYRFIETSVGSNSGYILDNKTAYEFTVSIVDEAVVATPSVIEVINEKPSITKTITAGVTNGSANIGDDITYTVTVDVPSTIDRLTTFTIKDTIDEGLDLNDDLIIKGLDSQGNVIATLTSADYTSEYDSQTRTTTITFVNTNLVDYDKLEGTYTAKLNSNALVTANTNSVSLTYSTIVDTDYTNTANTNTTIGASTDVDVYTGGFYIKKVDKNGNIITTGATFKVASTEANAKSGVYLTDENGDEITLTTGTDGYVSYKGLAYGTYWLVETKAPTYDDNGTTKSYNLLTSPVEITVDENSYSADNAVEIENRTGFTLPATGGVGTTLIITVGIVLVASGFVIYRKGKNDE